MPEEKKQSVKIEENLVITAKKRYFAAHYEVLCVSVQIVAPPKYLAIRPPVSPGCRIPSRAQVRPKCTGHSQALYFPPTIGMFVLSAGCRVLYGYSQGIYIFQQNIGFRLSKLCTIRHVSHP